MNQHSIKEKKSFKFTCEKEDNGIPLVDTIAKRTLFSKSLAKRLMVNGSVFQTFKGVRRHVRKARYTAKTGDYIECYYDPSINFEQEFEFNLLHETKYFGIYHKPSGAMTEGTKFGDKNSLIRFVEKKKIKTYLVNRLDRETEGLVVVAYDSKTQNLLQQMWKEKVTKRYQAIVLGELVGEGLLDQEINNKPTLTKYRSVKVIDDKTYVDIELVTERKHQARIQFADNGNPIIGDPLYGNGNKNNEGLQLISYCIEFIDPYSNQLVIAKLPKDRLLF